MHAEAEAFCVVLGAGMPALHLASRLPSSLQQVIKMSTSGKAKEVSKFPKDSIRLVAGCADKKLIWQEPTFW